MSARRMTSDAHGNVVGSPRMTKKRSLGGRPRTASCGSAQGDAVARLIPRPLESMQTGAELTRSNFGQRPAGLVALIVRQKQHRSHKPQAQGI